MLKQTNIQKKLEKLVEQKFGNGKRTLWKNKDFENLSFEIHKETKVLISVATLKRFFGKVKTSEDYKPQESTLDALMLYVAYKPSGGTRYSQRNILLGCVILALVILFLLVMVYTRKESAIDASFIGNISLLRTEGKCPTTAYFNYTLPDTNEPIFIDFGDKTRRLKVSEDGTRSHFYAYPGYFNVVLKGKTKLYSDNIKVLAGTEGWNALAYYFNLEKRERYYNIPIENNIEDGVFYTSKKELQNLGVNINEVVVVRLDNYKETGKSGDSFIGTSSFRNVSDWAAVQCYATIISIVGERGKIEIKFVGEGCSRFCELVLGEKVFDNIHHNLNGFVIDNDNWIDLMLVNKSKSLDIFVNKQLVFSDQYLQEIGDIVGTSISFNGSGSVAHFDIKTLDNECIISTDF